VGEEEFDVKPTVTIIPKAKAEKLWDATHQLAGMGFEVSQCIVIEPVHDPSVCGCAGCWRSCVTRGLPLQEAG